MLLRLSFFLTAFLVLAGCATGPSPDARTPAAPGAELSSASAMTFSLKGSRIIACCCTPPCPCRINMKPTQCHGCHYTEAIHCETGKIGDVDVSGLDWVFVGRGFGEDKTLNWSSVYVCDRASEAQMAALGKFFEAGAQALGKKVGYLVGSPLGLAKVPMSWKASAERHEMAMTIPKILRLETTAVINPGRKEPAVTIGVLDSYGDRLTHATPSVHTFDDPKIGKSFDLSGRQANQADFLLTSERVAQGGIGWGCWSAHAELGDTTKYPEQQMGKEKASDCCAPAEVKKN